MHVDDHAAGIAIALGRGEDGGIYNIGAGQERTNLEVVRQIVEVTGASDRLIRFVPDRPGHDRRYALNTVAVGRLGWRAPSTPLKRVWRPPSVGLSSIVTGGRPPNRRSSNAIMQNNTAGGSRTAHDLAPANAKHDAL